MTTQLVSLTLADRNVVIETPAGGVIASAWRAGRWYEAPLLEHVRGLHLKGLAVDAGANVGNHTLWFALACHLKVAAFEPLHAALLRANVERNACRDRVTVYETALGSGPAKALHRGKGELAVGTGTIPVAALDSFDLVNVVLIKADVEFMEPAVLAGGARTIQRDRPIIVAEVHPGHEQALADVLTPWRYVKTKRFHGKFSPTPVEEWRYRA